MAPYDGAAATAEPTTARAGLARGTAGDAGLTAACAAVAELARLSGVSAQADWAQALSDLAKAAGRAQADLSQQALRLCQLESLSVTDELTGLFNRRGFRHELTRALARAERAQETGLLLLVDLDHFKPINDTYGHAAGDQVLIAVGRVLDGAVRANDATARLGGDEFAVLLCDADPLAAQPRVAALRQALARLVVAHEGARLPVRATLGHAAYGPGSTADALVRAADADLYRHKHP
jgi:diguanylate cyclase (GGDEF)-like protein